ncbi:hypothetical protein EVC26_008 [Rhizobium phage RHph_I72]|nr:hypothetical protein EVC13_008 [Rhizobium phage RHph_I65]QIG76454.1 hypothetical protein EVC26_008 [Rhizobium phage RHph_I72]
MNDALWNWINERHAIYIRKSLREGKSSVSLFPNADVASNYLDEFLWASKGYPDGKGTHAAFSDDPILQQYRFCNVFRELDRVTAWIRFNIRRKWADHPNLWIMLAIARTINWPDTLQFLIDSQYAWPDNQDWKPEYLTRALEYYAKQGNKVYTGAYMIRAESDPKKEWYSWSKHRYIAEIVIGRLWEDRTEFQEYLERPPEVDSLTGVTPTLHGAWSMFQQPRYIGWGPFMAYQVVVDMRWTRYLENAPDINRWAALGPGSRRGLNRLAGRPVDYPLKQEDGLEEMRALWAEQDRRRAPWVPPIDLSDIQNALCETDKYLRVKNGEGKPRALYHPGRGY